MSKFSELLVIALAPVIKEIGKTKLIEVLDSLAKSDPAAHKTVLTSLYGPVDVHLEKITDKSKTKIDDVFVDGLKEAIEESAEKHGVDLQNLDTD